MRIVFMGTPEFAVPALQSLIAAGHDIAAVYTQPPRPAGRGHKLQQSPVHDLAQKHHIEVRTPKNFRDEDTRQALRELNADLGIVAAYGLILPQVVLDAPRMGCLNIHGSLLPRWRGAAPIHRAILSGDGVTGITIMRMEAGLDTGPMLSMQETIIAPDETFQSLHDRMAQMGANLLVKTLAVLDTQDAEIQPEDGVTYAHKITKEEGVLTGTETAQQVDRMVRSLNPWPGVWLPLQDGTRLKLLKGGIAEGSAEGKPFGDFTTKSGDMICAEGTLFRVQTIQGPNGKQMDVASAVNGGIIAL